MWKLKMLPYITGKLASQYTIWLRLYHNGVPMLVSTYLVIDWQNYQIARCRIHYSNTIIIIYFLIKPVAGINMYIHISGCSIMSGW